MDKKGWTSRKVEEEDESAEIARLRHYLTHERAEVEALRAEAGTFRVRLDNVYEERNLVVLLLARLMSTMIPTALGQDAWWEIDGAAEPGWGTTVFVEIAGKQMSWHLPDSPGTLGELAQEVLERYRPTDETDPPTLWDGHTTEEKYERVRELIRTL